MITSYSKKLRKAQENYIKQRFSKKLQEIPFEQWPIKDDPKRIKVFCSQSFLVQIFRDEKGVRISVNRSVIGTRSWQENITWDELQDIKNSVGYADYWAVECYPPTDNVVNVTNMRHLWILPEPPQYGWK